MKLEIDFSLQYDSITVKTPSGSVHFKDNEMDRGLLFRALRASAQALRIKESKENDGPLFVLGETNYGKDVSEAVKRYDQKSQYQRTAVVEKRADGVIVSKVRKFDERSKPVLNLEELEIEL